MRRFVAVLLLAACSETSNPPLRTPVPAEPVTSDLGRPLREAFGIGAQIPYYAGSEAKRAYQLAAAAEAGISHYRWEMQWVEIERTPGVFTWVHDEAVDAGLAVGQKWLGVVAYGNPLYSAASRADGNDHHYPPDDFADFEPYAEKLTAHYKGRIDRWEFWNEPNGGYRFWKSAVGGEAARFAELAVIGAKAMRRGKPDIKIALGGFFYHDYIVVPGAPRFLDAVLKARPELRGLYDAVSYHPYKPYPPIDPPEMAGSWDEDQDDTVAAMRAVMAAHGWQDKELWITENGWPIGPLVDEARQAQYLVRGALLAFSKGVREYDWYTFWDYEDPSKALVPPEAYFGLVRPGPGSPPFSYREDAPDAPVRKQAFTATAVMLKTLGTCRAVTDLPGAARAMGARLVQLTGKGCRAIAAWHTALGGTLAIDVPTLDGAAPSRAVGMLGEAMALPAEGAKLVLDGSPVYLLYPGHGTPAE